MGHQQEKGLLRGLLDHFQQGVARGGIHFLRQVNHHCPVSSFHRGKGQGREDGTRLCHGNRALLFFNADGFVQLIFREIRIPQQQVPERSDKLQRHRVFLPGDRKDEMDVRMDQFSHPGIAPVEFLQKVQDERERPAAVVLMQHHGMRNPAAHHHLVQGGHDVGIPIDFHLIPFFPRHSGTKSEDTIFPPNVEVLPDNPAIFLHTDPA